MLDLKKLLTKILQELKYSKLNTDNYTNGKGNTVSFSVDNNTGEVSVASQGIEITPSQINGKISASNITGLPAASTDSPQPVGTSATAGTATTWSKSDHVHNISKNTITGALGYTPYNNSNPDGYGKITGISSTAPINGSGTTGTINLSHSTSGVTAGTYGSTSTATETPAFGANIIVPGFNVNNTGHITTASTHNITIPSNTFTAATSAAAGQKGLVPATSTLTTATFDGTTGLSNYWLNANGNWANIPFATQDINTGIYSGGLMPSGDYRYLQYMKKRYMGSEENRREDGFFDLAAGAWKTYSAITLPEIPVSGSTQYFYIAGSARFPRTTETCAIKFVFSDGTACIPQHIQKGLDRENQISSWGIVFVQAESKRSVHAQLYCTSALTGLSNLYFIAFPVASDLI